MQHCLPPALYMFYRREHANDLELRGELESMLRFVGEGEKNRILLVMCRILYLSDHWKP